MQIICLIALQYFFVQRRLTDRDIDELKEFLVLVLLVMAKAGPGYSGGHCSASFPCLLFSF